MVSLPTMVTYDANPVTQLIYLCNARPTAPKRNQSAFFLYSNATRNDVKEANPEAKFGDIAKIISTHFKALPTEERAYWDNKAAEDKARCEFSGR